MSMVSTSPVTRRYEIALPPRDDSLSQDEEWCVVHWKGEWQKVLIHDYEMLFSIPGLYEQVIYDILGCRSPVEVRKTLEGELSSAGAQPADIRALDLGAGNGMVAEELADMGVASVTGIDIIQRAAEAAERDRPGLYSDYLILDMARLSETEHRQLDRHRPNCLVCVAALGFGDIPTDAFRNAFNLIQPRGWIAFNIKEEFLGKSDDTGFSGLASRLESSGALEVRARRRYQHRLGTDGNPIHYLVIVGRKRFDLPHGKEGQDEYPATGRETPDG